MMAPEHDFYRD
jgi:protein transport protein SEC24